MPNLFALFYTIGIEKSIKYICKEIDRDAMICCAWEEMHFIGIVKKSSIFERIVRENNTENYVAD